MMTRRVLRLAGLAVAFGLIIILVILVVLLSMGYFYQLPPEHWNVTPLGAVVSNGGPCAEIGMNIMKKYGNAVDSIIATMLCDGVTTMNNMGIGGGFIATIYIKSEGKAYSLNARETAPKKSYRDMFDGNTSLSRIGGLSVAVPGELRGYWEMYERFGGAAPWAELFQPTIELCKTGVPINKHIATNIYTHASSIKESPTLYSLLKKPDGTLPVEGDKVKLLKLAETLKLVANSNPDVLYNGPLSQLLIDDIVNDGGIMTLEDLAEYKVRWEEPVTYSLKNDTLKMYSVPEPGSGSILGLILKLVDGFLNVKQSLDIQDGEILPAIIPDINDTFIITEAFKYAYAFRSRLGDPHFHNISKVLEKMNDPKIISRIKTKLMVNVTSSEANDYGADYLTEDHGTANMAVIAPNGDAVVVTSTVNLIFGSKLVSNNTGIILNDEMDDFSSPNATNHFGVAPSKSNFIVPGAVPQSSMCPSIFVDSNTGDVKLAIGAAGGTKITTATALVALRTLWYNINLRDAIKMPRFHHQLMPMEWTYEPKTNQQLIDEMVRRGHIAKKGNPIDSCVTGILKSGQDVHVSSDLRRPGNVAILPINSK